MSKNKVILITGVSGYWGRQVATQLAGRPGYHVVGVDGAAPQDMIKGLDFIQADVRNSKLVELIQSEHVDTLVHLAFVESSHPNEYAFDMNVMGTMKVFAACAEAGVKKIILRSSTAVYGARPANSAFLNENHPLRGSTQTGWIRDLVEIEAFCNGFRRQSPEICLTVLRFPNIIGPTIDSPITRMLKLRTPPVLMGFEPQMQFIHETDAVEALVHAVEEDVPGTFNIAAENALPLGKVMALTGRIPVPVFHLFAYWGSTVLGGAHLDRMIPLELDYIRYPWVGDLRRMHEDFGFVPKYTAEEALREFAGQQRVSGFKEEESDLSFDEERLKDTIERRNRLRSRGQAETASFDTDEEEEENNE